MNETLKKQIAKALRDYCDRMGSQNKAANSLGISPATVSHMLSGEWSLIKPEMWRGVAAQIGCKSTDWVAVETTDYAEFTKILTDAQDNALVMAVTGEAGTGKSFAAKNYVLNNNEVYILSCAEYWNRKTFLGELLSSMGRNWGGFTVNEMMNEAVKYLKQAEKPMIILDEADKLNDQVLYFFITLYNQLEGHCAIVMCATDHLAKRINRGKKLNKKGYKEIYSRLGRKFIELNGLTAADIAAVCKANGVDHPQTIQEIVDDSEGDMRRVKRKIHSIKKELEAA